MKKLLSITLVFLLLLSTIACTSGCTANISHEKLHFNGRTYIENGGTDDKFLYDYKQDADTWKRITVSSKSSYNGTEYYGDDISNPNFIVTNTSAIYIREDIKLDHNAELVVKGTENPFVFRISEAITGEHLDSLSNETDSYRDIFHFVVSFKQYPYVRMNIHIYRANNQLYLQECTGADYYVITDDFQAYLHRVFRDYLGLRSL